MCPGKAKKRLPRENAFTERNRDAGAKMWLAKFQRRLSGEHVPQERPKSLYRPNTSLVNAKSLYRATTSLANAKTALPSENNV